MSGINKFRYGNRPNEAQKFVQGNLIKTAVDIWGGNGATARRIHDAAYDYLYPAGPEFGQSSLTQTKYGSGMGTRPYRVNQLRRRHLRGLHRKMSFRRKLYKRR